MPDNFEPIDVAMKKKGKKCSCGQYDATGNCACGYGWAFAPLYGDGEGNSGATFPPGNVSSGGQSPSPGSPAYPGAGGVNAPGVPAGPNSGMGPVTASRARRRGVATLAEALDFAIRATTEPTVIDSPPEVDGNQNGMVDDAPVPPVSPPPPAVVTVAPPAPAGPTVGSILIAAVHRAFTQAGDVLYAHGLMDQETRIALSGCVGDALRELTAALAAKAPAAAAVAVEPSLIRACLEARR